jgi:23S rRNA (uracil1939-C5)-methyltransferase
MTQSNAKNTFTLEIESLSYGPYGIGRVEGQVIMIPGTVPQDKISARITEQKDNHAIGQVVDLLEPSPQRRSPPCVYYSACGGCPWQQVQYPGQLAAKQRAVEDALRRIGKLADFDLRPILPSSQEYQYRRRIRLQADRNHRLGFYRPASHDLVEIESCLIADQRVDVLVPLLRRWIRDLQTAIEGVEIVAGDRPGEIIIVMTGRDDFIQRDDATCQLLLRQNPMIRGLLISSRDWRRTWGDTTITVFAEDGVPLKVAGDVFTQVNSEGNRSILRELLASGQFNAKDRVLELYCGAGNFTLSVAKRVNAVLAVEAYRPSIDSGKLSAQLNDLRNIRWSAAHVPMAVQQLRQRDEEFTKIILDPPRAGAKGIEGNLAALDAEKILYVSCNPATLARDLAALTKHGYQLLSVQPFDLFPQTFHVESLAVMERA